MATRLPPIRRAPFCLIRFVFVLCTVPIGVEAQAPTRETAPAELVRTITALDSALFASYNRCELDTFASFWASDIEFYHDQSGLTLGVQKLTDAVRANICGKVRRQLVPGTLEVYIMHGYGALETGVHRFYPAGPDQVEAMGEARFILLWHRRDGAWKITRSVTITTRCRSHRRADVEARALAVAPSRGRTSNYNWQARCPG